jgi:hypothetical protein
VAGNVAALAEGVLQAMRISRLKLAVGVILSLALLSTGAGVLAFSWQPAKPDPAKKAEPLPEKDEKAELLRKKAAARIDVARTAYAGYLLRFQLGMENEQTVNLWSRRWLQASLDQSEKKADRDAALRAHRDRVQRVDEIARARLDLGGSPEPVTAVEGELKNHETVLQQFMDRKATTEQVCHASVRLLMAQQVFRKEFKLQIADERALAGLRDQVGFDLKDEKSEYQAHLNRLEKVEALTRVRVEAGASGSLDQDTVTFYRLEAEEWLARKKRFTEDVLNPGARLKE